MFIKVARQFWDRQTVARTEASVTADDNLVDDANADKPIASNSTQLFDRWPVQHICTGDHIAI